MDFKTDLFLIVFNLVFSPTTSWDFPCNLLFSPLLGKMFLFIQEREAVGKMEEREERRNRAMSNLAPGYRFYPTEEELIGFYLRNKLERRRDDLDRVIPVYDIYSLDPWQLPSWHLFLLPTPTSSFA